MDIGSLHVPSEKITNGLGQIQFPKSSSTKSLSHIH
jgi:hypothetical protein